jgi:hypothetical protein
MKKILAVSLVFSSIALSLIALGVGGPARIRPNPNADAFIQGPEVDTSSAVVQLKGDPLSTYSATKPAAGRKIDFTSSAVTSYRAQLSNRTQRFQKMAASQCTERNDNERV